MSTLGYPDRTFHSRQLRRFPENATMEETGFFDRDPLSYFARPRFELSIEYFALGFEIVGLLFAAGNCVFLANKLRRASSGFMLKGLLIVSLLVITMIISQFFLIYWTFSRASVMATTWSCTAAQVLLIFVTTDTIKVFVPNIQGWVLPTLRAFNGSIAIALATPGLLRGPLFVDTNAPGVVTAWYRATNAIWCVRVLGSLGHAIVTADNGTSPLRTMPLSGYVFFYDFCICVFIAYQIYHVSRTNMYNLHGVTQSSAGGSRPNSPEAVRSGGQVTSASTLPTATTAVPTSPINTDFAAIKAEFKNKVRITVVTLVLFLMIIIANVHANFSFNYYASNFSMVNMLYTCAYIQIGLGCGGPHVAFISIMLYNVTQLLLASRGTSSGRKRRAKGKAGKTGTRTATSGDTSDDSSTERK
ncbi:hypothetical protein HK105_206622 [Polyrhizophydium stewartii]|uniref:Uncharacterized protein n=1 Tax=Polyrhizophydium stewartii TaxID=2732419 RepID=A0ABR4N306_9FUNG